MAGARSWLGRLVVFGASNVEIPGQGQGAASRVGSGLVNWIHYTWCIHPPFLLLGSGLPFFFFSGDNNYPAAFTIHPESNHLSTFPLLTLWCKPPLCAR